MSASVPARILVIDDSGTSRAFIVHLLEASNYVLLEAGDGESGVRFARTEQPDLIVCDVDSSKLDGYSVLRGMKKDETLRHIPAVALTAAAQRERILAAGFDGFVNKPIEPEIFVQEIENFLPLGRRSKGARTRPRKAGGSS